MSEIVDREWIAERLREENRVMSDEYNNGYTHEVMHTAHVLLDTWDQHVAETRTCEQFPDLKDAAHKAAAAMFFFYQLAGQKFS